MKYQIAYLGRSDNTARIARSIADALPAGEYILTDMDRQALENNSNVYILCFDLLNEACPYVLLDFIEKLEGKTILLIGTSGLSVEKSYQVRIEAQILPFLPDVCDYRGLHLCRGRMTEADLKRIKEKADAEDEALDVDRLKKIYQASQEHPDMMDIYNVLQFLNERMNDTNR